MTISLQPLCEVFGFPVDNFSDEANYYRSEKLCPFNNQSRYCTKAKKNNPLGVCSVWENGHPIIVCPVRFRQNWQIIQETKDFLVPKANEFEFVSEVKINDADDESVGKIDIVEIDLDQNEINNYGALEIQAVYISGNIREPFDFYINHPPNHFNLQWNGPNYPSPDWLSSIKRLEHQLIVKGLLLSTWKKRLAVVIQKPFFDHFRSIQKLQPVSQDEADVGWFLYDLIFNPEENRYNLKIERTIWFRMTDLLQQFTHVPIGEETGFILLLQNKIRLKHRRQSP